MQPKEHVPDIWSLCDAALSPSERRSDVHRSNPFKDLRSHGNGAAHSISAPEGEATEIVAAEYAGIVLPPENPPALAAAVRSLRDDHAGRKKYAENSLAAAPLQSRKAG